MLLSKEKKVLLAVIVALLIVGTFLDLQISIFLYNSKSIFGRFFENHALLLVFVPVIMSSITIFKDKKNKIILIFPIIVSMYAAYQNVHGYIQDKLMLVITSLLMGSMMFVLLYIFSTKQAKSKHYETLLVFAIIVLVIHAIKLIDGRIRFRDFQDIITYTQYTPWYQFNFLQPGNSFPSGHTSTMYVIVLLLNIYNVHSKTIRYSAYILVFLMALSRIVIGAHFLSDTMMALIIAIVMEMLWKFYRKKYDE